MNKVSVVRNGKKATDEVVYGLVKESIDLLGDIEKFVKFGDTVALKPNVVTGEGAGPGVKSKKRVVTAMTKLCKEARASKVLVVEGAGARTYAYAGVWNYFTFRTWNEKFRSRLDMIPLENLPSCS